MARGSVMLLLAGACWQERGQPTTRTVASTRAETHEERFESVSIPQIESDLRLGPLTSFLNGPLVFLDLDAGELRVLCGDDARQRLEEIASSFTDTSRPKPHCDDSGERGYELRCGQMVFHSGQPMRNHEVREIDLVVERGGEIRLESAWSTLQGNELNFPYYVHEFNQAKKHARCPR